VEDNDSISISKDSLEVNKTVKNGNMLPFFTFT
jgi:hypothetical protein